VRLPYPLSRRREVVKPSPLERGRVLLRGFESHRRLQRSIGGFGLFLRPSCLYSFSGASATLFLGHFSSPGSAAELSALATHLDEELSDLRGHLLSHVAIVREAHTNSKTLPIDIRDGVTYNLLMKLNAPIKTPILTGAVITTAKAAVTCKPIIGFPAVDLKEIHSDLPQLPNRRAESWETSQRTSALSLFPMR
jgi:hypothetical protein